MSTFACIAYEFASRISCGPWVVKLDEAIQSECHIAVGRSAALAQCVKYPRYHYNILKCILHGSVLIA